MLNGGTYSDHWALEGLAAYLQLYRLQSIIPGMLMQCRQTLQVSLLNPIKCWTAISWFSTVFPHEFHDSTFEGSQCHGYEHCGVCGVTPCSLASGTHYTVRVPEH